MTIYIKKFGTVLTSRQAGREAYAAFLPTLQTIGSDEKVLIDFEGISSFSPSWGDEFLTPLKNTFGPRLILQPSKNHSVELTIETLEMANKFIFDRT
jgi:hypothetical protein